MKITLTEKIEIEALTSSILLQFPKAGLELRGSLLCVENIDDTQKNRESIETIIADHNYDAAIITQKLNKIRDERTKRLCASDWYIKRHIDQTALVALGLLVSTSISNEKYQEWLVYQQDLRDFLSICDSEKPVWPIKPA